MKYTVLTAIGPVELARYPSSPEKPWRDRMANVRDLIALLKSSPCSDCGHRFPPAAMDFDHVRGPKLFAISQGVGKPVAVVLAEIAKCELVCSNCHRIRTATRIGSRLAA